MAIHVGTATINGRLEVGDAPGDTVLHRRRDGELGGQLVGQGTVSGDVNVMSGGMVAPGTCPGPPSAP